MFLANTRWIALFCPLLSIIAIGCAGNSAPPFEEMQLRNIYDIYQRFIKSEERPPAELSDLNKQPFIAIHPVTVTNLQECKYIVVFGVKTKDASTVLAYEKDVPEAGGAVLMADGAVKKMTAAEFKAAMPTK